MINYTCTGCGQRYARDQLLVKRASFFKMGRGGKQIRTRTVGWFCKRCLENDRDWNRDSYQFQTTKQKGKPDGKDAA